MNIERRPPSQGGQSEPTLITEKRTAREVRLELRGLEGPVGLRVRTEGALIRDLTIAGTRVLTSPDTRDLETDDDFLQPLKMDGTITMLPVGSSEVGPRHGLSRYLSYTIEQSGSRSLTLAAHDRLLRVDHLKTFDLTECGLMTVDRVVNRGDSPIGLSLGEHFYFAVAESDLAGIQFLDPDYREFERSITVRFSDGTNHTAPPSAFLSELSAGRTLYWDVSEFNNFQKILIPNLGVIELGATAWKGHYFQLQDFRTFGQDPGISRNNSWI